MKMVLVIILSYLLGSCSMGIIISKLTTGIDIRTQGSKNAGATNVLRVLGKKAALITLIGDALKGVLAALLGKWLVGGTFGAMLGSVFSVLGHNFPVFFGFKGGKGIATSFGSLLIALPVPILISAITFAITVAISKFVSLGSILGAAILPISYLIVCPFELRVFLLLLFEAGMAIWRHKANIERLLSHTENKLDFSSK